MAAILMHNCIDGKIIDCGFENFDVAIEATDSRNIQIIGGEINNCNKGIKFNDCWDSGVTGTIVNNSRSSDEFRLSLLSAVIQYYMWGRHRIRTI